MKLEKTYGVILGLALSLLISGCSSSDATNPASAPEAAASFKAANDTIAAASGLVPNTLPRASRVQSARAAGTLGSMWGTDFLPDPRCSGGMSDPHCGINVSLRAQMGFMTDANAVRDNGSSINIFGRLKGAMSTSCAITSLLAYSNGGVLPTTGTHTVTFSSTTNSILTTYCGMASEDIPPAGMEATVMVTPTTDTTYYDSKIDIILDGGTMTNYLRATATELNIAQSEADSGNFSRNWVSLNRVTGVVRAEYTSYSSTGSGAGEMHRLYFDSINNIAAMVGSSYDYNTPPNSNQMIFAMTGKPGTAGDTAFSLAVKGFGLTTADAGASDSTLNLYKGCLSGVDGDITATGDDTVACAGGITGVDMSAGLATLFTQFLTNLEMNGAGLSDATLYGEGHSVPFTNATDIFSSAIPIAP